MNNVPTVDKGNLSPDELQDRLNQLRNPGKKQKDEEYGKKMKAYLERYGDTYDFDEISFKKEELPLDTDVYSQAIKKIQRIERGRQSRKKYTKKKPVSRYFEKQWKNFNIEMEKSDMKEVFVEHEPSPEPEEETMYTRRRTKKNLQI